MSSIRRLIKSIDIFGKPILLKFDKKWDTHKTKLGGLSTMIIYIIILM